MRDLTNAEQWYITKTSPDQPWQPGNCPWCGAENPWLEGPHGGLAVNLKCEQCHTIINWCGPLPSQLIELGDGVPTLLVADVAYYKQVYAQPASFWVRFRRWIRGEAA